MKSKTRNHAKPDHDGVSFMLKPKARVGPSGDDMTPILDDSYENYSKKSSNKTITICTMCGRYKGYRIRRNIFILLCIAIVLLLILVGIIVVLFAIVPAIVRSTIDKAELGFRTINIGDIQKDRFRLRAQLVLSRTGSISATIHAPLTINVDNLATVTNHQSIYISGDSDQSTVVPIDSPFIISDLETFRGFSRSLIFESSVTWHLTAKASVEPISSAMPVYSNIPLDKKVTLTALNSLQNVTIRSISLRRSDAQRVIADIVIVIPNPSIFTIELGELYFDLRFNSAIIGYVKSVYSNVTLLPNENAILFSGELQSNTVEAFNALSTVIQNFLIGQTSKVEAKAGPNATSHALLAAGMEGLVLSVPMPPFDEQLITTLVFKSMSLIPSTSDKRVVLSAVITIKINSPLGHQSPLNISTMDMNVALLYENNSVGTLDVHQTQVIAINENTYETEFTNKDLVLSGTGKTYEKFAQDFIRADAVNPVNFHIVGRASIAGSFALGPLHIEGIQVRNAISLVGLAGLNSVRVHGISVVGELENALQLSINITIDNPGVTEVELKNFTLQMADTESKTILGKVPISILALQPGTNDMTLNGLLAPNSEIDLPAVGNFFSAYLNQQTQSVTLFHEVFIEEENTTAMDITVSDLSMTANLEGIQAQLIERVEILNFGIKFDPINVSRVFITGELLVLFQLPPNVQMSFEALTTSIDYYMRFNDGPYLGQMTLNSIPVEHDQINNKLLMKIYDEQLVVLNETEFQQFAAKLVLTNDVLIAIDGLASALAEIIIGNITLSNIPVNDTIHLIGYNQFNNGLLKIEEIDITGASASDTLSLSVRTLINNPSAVYILNGGSLSLDLCELTSGVSLGLVIIDPFYLEPQSNSTVLTAQGSFIMTAQNSIRARDFISRMVSGLDSLVELRGILPNNSIGTSIPLLSKAIEGLRVRTQVSGLTDERTLVREIILKKLTLAQIAGISLNIVKTLTARIRLKNPFSTPLTIRQMNIRADFDTVVNEDSQVGTVTDNSIIRVDAHNEIVTGNIEVKITARLLTMTSLLIPLAADTLRLSLSGFINVDIDGQFRLIQLPITLLNITTTQDGTIE